MWRRFAGVRIGLTAAVLAVASVLFALGNAVATPPSRIEMSVDLPQLVALAEDFYDTERVSKATTALEAELDRFREWDNHRFGETYRQAPHLETLVQFVRAFHKGSKSEAAKSRFVGFLAAINRSTALKGLHFGPEYSGCVAVAFRFEDRFNFPALVVDLRGAVYAGCPTSYGWKDFSLAFRGYLD